MVTFDEKIRLHEDLYGQRGMDTWLRKIMLLYLKKPSYDNGDQEAKEVFA